MLKQSLENVKDFVNNTIVQLNSKQYTLFYMLASQKLVDNNTIKYVNISGSAFKQLYKEKNIENLICAECSLFELFNFQEQSQEYTYSKVLSEKQKKLNMHIRKQYYCFNLKINIKKPLTQIPIYSKSEINNKLFFNIKNFLKQVKQANKQMKILNIKESLSTKDKRQLFLNNFFMARNASSLKEVYNKIYVNPILNYNDSSKILPTETRKHNQTNNQVFSSNDNSFSSEEDLLSCSDSSESQFNNLSHNKKQKRVRNFNKSL